MARGSLVPRDLAPREALRGRRRRRRFADLFEIALFDKMRTMRKLNRSKYEAMVDKAYSKFQQNYREITLEQAQAIIFGAVEYAQKLGLKLHWDWSKAKDHLGQPSENLLAIEFGRKGKPFYVSGPYDNPDKIVAKLRETVGEGNFDYLMLG